MTKEKCKCGKIATWCYLPKDILYCDDCVPRGCGCNIYAINEFGFPENENIILYKKDDIEKQIDNYPDIIKEGLKVNTSNLPTNISDYAYYEHLDENGRVYPCCEFMYDEEGFDI